MSQYKRNLVNGGEWKHKNIHSTRHVGVKDFFALLQMCMLRVVKNGYVVIFGI